MVLLSITTVIVAITVIVSILAFNDRELSYKLTLSPYSVRHHNRWWLIFTHGVIHADYMHLGLNMYVLYNFGRIVEYEFIYNFGNVGYLYYIALYIGGLLFASLPSLKKHADNPSYLAVGASGAVSAVVFSSVILYPTGSMSLIFLPFGIPSFIFGALYLFAEHYLNKKGTTKIAHDAHIAGAFFGVLFTVVINYQFLLNFISKINDWFSTVF